LNPVPDFFALLDEPRRPWLDPDLLKAKFITRSAYTHPDRVHNAPEAERAAASQRYTELNAAYHCLRDHRNRLAHLLQLELGSKPKDLQQMPEDLARAFMEVAQLCRQVDDYLLEKERAASPMLQVQLFERGQEWVETIGALQVRLATRREDLIQRLKALDAGWDTMPGGSAARGDAVRQLEEIYRLLSFFARWSEQMQERLARIAA
jgi:DnaJ-domain-containing protein 1